MATLLAKSQDILTERNKLTPNKIKGGETVFGITGTYQTDLSNLKPSTIKKGVTIQNVTGIYEYAPAYVSFYRYPYSTIDFDGLGYIVPRVLPQDCVHMFSNTQLTALDLSEFDSSNVTDMYGMFSSSYSLTSLDLSSFDTSNVTNMTDVLYGCSRLSTIKFGEDWQSYGTQTTYTNQTSGTWTRSGDGQTYTGLQALLEAGRTKGAIARYLDKILSFIFNRKEILNEYFN